MTASTIRNSSVAETSAFVPGRIRHSSVYDGSINNLDKYYLNSNGTAVTGWKKTGGHWYAFWGLNFYPISVTGHGLGTRMCLTGVMFRNTTEAFWDNPRSTTKASLYSFNKKGQMLTGWKKVGKTCYYHDPKSGKAVDGWQKISGKWYYFSSKKVKLLQSLKGRLSAFRLYGCVMQTGWKTISGKKYYFGSNGAMRTGKQKIKGKTYLFARNGVLIKRVK